MLASYKNVLSLLLQVAIENGKLKCGDHVALLYPPGLDLIAAVYGCFYVGLIPVPIRPPNPNNMLTTLPTVKMIVQVSKSVAILTNTQLIKLLHTKDDQHIIDSKVWPPMVNTDDSVRRRGSFKYRTPPTPEMLAYLDFSVSTTGMLAGVKVRFLSTSLILPFSYYHSKTTLF